MHQFIALLGLASTALASPYARDNVNRQNAASPCAEVSASVAAQRPAATPTVSAKLAYDCINSVPLNKTAALDLLSSVVPYFRWQSTTVWLKDPPAEYREKIQDAVDVWGGLRDIRSKVQNSTYRNEYEFGFAFYTLLQSTHDGHFVYVPDSVGSIFNFARPVPLVSVSADGKELPKPYVYSDVLAEYVGNASFSPSAIVKINGINATTYLENWSQRGSLQDRDALYNNVFYELATVSLGPVGSGIGTFAGSGRGRWVYPGPDTSLEFANGTTRTYQNFARVLVPFTGVTDGTSLYQKYFTGALTTETEEAPASNSTTPTSSATPTATPTPTGIPAPGYPPPVYREKNNLIGGYYLDGEYSDVAVLSVPSFVGSETDELPFQQVGERFLAAAKAAGKTKLIIDLSANGGGTILQGYDLYKQLFPQGISHAAGDRWRAFESTNLIGTYFSQVSETLPRTLVDPDVNETLYNLEGNIVSSNFNYQTDTDTDGENFLNWPVKFGPHIHKGDSFSSLSRWNLSDVLTPYNSGGIYIHGFGNLTNFTQPFAAADITVVTDGYCASTCTIFSELMRQRAGVKYISLGGRARPGITQAIGGVKGTNDLPWTYIQSLAQTAIELASTPAEAAALNKTQLGQYYDNTFNVRAAVGSSYNVNFRDGIRDADLPTANKTRNIPLQFVYEAADCRILYTKAMTVDATAIWKAAADTAYKGKNQCVAGSLGGYAKRSDHMQLSERDVAHTKRMQAWRRSLSVADYPLDVYTDLRGVDLSRQGIMWP